MSVKPKERYETCEMCGRESCDGTLPDCETGPVSEPKEGDAHPDQPIPLTTDWYDETMKRIKKGAAQPEHTKLIQRIGEAVGRISKMCSEGRPPKMSIPVRPEDDDIFISETLVQCRDALRAHPVVDAPGGPWRVSHKTFADLQAGYGETVRWFVVTTGRRIKLHSGATEAEAIAVRDAFNGVNRLEGETK